MQTKWNYRFVAENPFKHKVEHFQQEPMNFRSSGLLRTSGHVYSQPLRSPHRHVHCPYCHGGSCPGCGHGGAAATTCGDTTGPSTATGGDRPRGSSSVRRCTCSRRNSGCYQQPTTEALRSASTFSSHKEERVLGLVFVLKGHGGNTLDAGRRTQ